MTAKCSELLAHRATVLADWADRMPLRDVYIFGDHTGADVGADAKLKIAIEYSSNASDEMMRCWQRENATDFAELKKALGIDTEFFTDQDHDVWAPIRDAARTPIMIVRKVRLVRT